MKGDSVLIAPLASKPQLVTLAMDLLRERGERVREAVILHTSLAWDVMRASVACLGEEFRRCYPGVRLRPICLCGPDGAPLDDVESDEGVAESFRVLYREVKAAKQAGRRVHLSVTGGRKVIAVYAMTAAQLLFDPDDCVWHISSVAALIERKSLHAQPGESRLVWVPVLRWSEVSPMLTDLALNDDPFQAMARYEELRHADAQRAAREFVERELSRAEREVVELLVCEGLTEQKPVG